MSAWHPRFLVLVFVFFVLNLFFGKKSKNGVYLTRDGSSLNQGKNDASKSKGKFTKIALTRKKNIFQKNEKILLNLLTI